MDATIDTTTSSEFSKVVFSQQEENDDNLNIYDYTEIFTTDQVFHSRESLSNWVCMVGKELGLVIVITHSERGGYGRKPRIRYGCERSGKYTYRINHSGHESKRKRSVGTHKCECPFDLKGVKLSTKDDWMLKVLCGLHNHLAAQHLEGHPYVQRLTNEEEQILIDMSKSLVKPRNILMTLKERDPNNVSTMRTIYNARARHRLIDEAGRTQMQHLMRKLKEHNYIEWHRSHERSDEVRDLFFAHPTYVDFLHAFSCVLIMDCTYKTNRYRRPLLEIVGVTSTQKTFSVAFVFMESEHKSNYIWAMEKLKTLMNHDVLPHVIVTFLPLHSQPPLPLNHKIISLGFVNDNHFVQVNLKPNCPIPPVAYNWYKFRDDIARGWESTYKKRIQTFKEMIGTDIATQEICNVNSP